MALSRHSSRVYMDDLELEGAINVLRRKAAEEENHIHWGIYSGAARALSILYDHEYIDKPDDFMTIFDIFKREDTNA